MTGPSVKNTTATTVPAVTRDFIEDISEGDSYESADDIEEENNVQIAKKKKVMEHIFYYKHETGSDDGFSVEIETRTDTSKTVRYVQVGLWRLSC